MPDHGPLTPQRQQYKKPYAEASVFIALIRGEVLNGVDRGAIGEHILRMGQSGVYRIYTATWTMAEVHKKRTVPAVTLSTENDLNVLALFEQEFFELIQLDREIGEDANRIAREKGLMPGDAVHVASALRAECDVLLSWDRHLVGKTDLGISAEYPQLIGQAQLPPMPHGRDSKA